MTMTQTEPPIYEPELLHEHFTLDLPHASPFNNFEVLPPLEAEQMHELELPQPPEPEDDRDWAISKLYRFIAIDHFQFLIKHEYVQLLPNEKRPKTPDGMHGLAPKVRSALVLK